MSGLPLLIQSPVTEDLLRHARVSTLEQNSRLQTDALKSAGCYRVFTDRASGALDERRELPKLFDQARPGDTVVVSMSCFVSAHITSIFSRPGGSSPGPRRRINIWTARRFSLPSFLLSPRRTSNAARKAPTAPTNPPAKPSSSMCAQLASATSTPTVTVALVASPGLEFVHGIDQFVYLRDDWI
jgi:hypothetical protein